MTWRVAGRMTGGSALDIGRFEALTFDCYGTLIDWESGILAGLQPILARPGARPAPDEEILERYATIEAELEAGPYQPYREILGEAARRLGRSYGVEPTADEARAFGGSVGDWPAFPDSPDALRRLASRYRLGVITSDDDLFAASNRRLDVTFDWIVTAQQARSYKPSVRNFELAFDRLGLPRERILHVAQSLFHDHVPARQLGLATAWIDRRHGRSGSGATPPASAKPDATFPDMASFADAALG